MKNNGSRNRDCLWQIDPIKKKNSKILLYRFKIIPRKTMDYNDIVTIFGNYQLLKKKKSIVKYRFKINSNETMDYDQL